MLLIQNINLTWHKKERGAEGKRARSQFPPVYPLEKEPSSGDVFIHNLNFYQDGNTFKNSIQEARQSLQEYLPRYGYTQEQIQREIQNRLTMIQKNQYQSYSSADALNLTNLSVCCKEDQYAVTFFYDQQRSGMPFRRGHNKDFRNPDSRFYGMDVLNETAFVLAEYQYGRIIWNERNTDYDTGTWYYQLHIYNLFHLSDRNFSKDIFVKNKLTYEYRQLAALH